MTDNELRAIRDANRDNEVLVDIVNRAIKSRRNVKGISDPERRAGVESYIDRLLGRVRRFAH